MYMKKIMKKCKQVDINNKLGQRQHQEHKTICDADLETSKEENYLKGIPLHQLLLCVSLLLVCGCRGVGLAQSRVFCSRRRRPDSVVSSVIVVIAKRIMHSLDDNRDHSNSRCRHRSLLYSDG